MAPILKNITAYISSVQVNTIDEDTACRQCKSFAKIEVVGNYLKRYIKKGSVTLPVVVNDE